nr:MAG TPA: hypothetical protein [Caudoviricetes sp.]
MTFSCLCSIIIGTEGLRQVVRPSSLIAVLRFLHFRRTAFLFYLFTFLRFC